jgi:hypothetical protein
MAAQHLIGKEVSTEHMKRTERRSQVQQQLEGVNSRVRTARELVNNSSCLTPGERDTFSRKLQTMDGELRGMQQSIEEGSAGN